MWCFSVCNTLMLTWTWQPNWWVGAQEGKAEDYLPALSFHSKSKQQRSMMIFLPNKLGKNMFKSHKAELWKLPFSRQLLHHTMRCAALGRIGLKLLLLVEMWCSCTTTKCAGINIPVLVVSWGTLSPLTEKLADSTVQSCVHSQGRAKLAKGFVACQQRMALCGVWLGWTCDSSLLPYYSPYYRPSSSPKLFLPFVFLSWADVPYYLSSIDKWVGTEILNWRNCFSTGSFYGPCSIIKYAPS